MRDIPSDDVALEPAAPPVRQFATSNRPLQNANFPEIAAAALARLSANAVCDGELVSWAGDRLSFDLLQQRLAAGPARARALSAALPASYVMFDLLAARSVDLRGRPFDERRSALEALTTWSPPLQLSPITDDYDTAKAWLADHARADAGIEGMVAKGAATIYRPGARGWAKYKHRTTEEAVVGAVIGPITRPEGILAGSYTQDGQLVIVGRRCRCPPPTRSHWPRC